MAHIILGHILVRTISLSIIRKDRLCFAWFKEILEALLQHTIAFQNTFCSTGPVSAVGSMSQLLV